MQLTSTDSASQMTMPDTRYGIDPEWASTVRDLDEDQRVRANAYGDSPDQAIDTAAAIATAMQIAQDIHGRLAGTNYGDYIRDGEIMIEVDGDLLDQMMEAMTRLVGAR